MSKVGMRDLKHIGLGCDSQVGGKEGFPETMTADIMAKLASTTPTDTAARPALLASTQSLYSLKGSRRCSKDSDLLSRLPGHTGAWYSSSLISRPHANQAFLPLGNPDHTLQLLSRTEAVLGERGRWTTNEDYPRLRTSLDYSPNFANIAAGGGDILSSYFFKLGLMSLSSRPTKANLVPPPVLFDQRGDSRLLAADHLSSNLRAPPGVLGMLTTSGGTSHGHSSKLMAIHHHQQEKNKKTPAGSVGRGSEPFPEKLHRLLREVELLGRLDVVSFVSDDTFRIHDPYVFFHEVLPQYFRQTKLTSFKRQLKLYGFELLQRGRNIGGYRHKLFSKKNPSLCRQLRRVAIKKGPIIKQVGSRCHASSNNITMSETKQQQEPKIDKNVTDETLTEQEEASRPA